VDRIKLVAVISHIVQSITLNERKGIMRLPTNIYANDLIEPRSIITHRGPAATSVQIKEFH
jgi:hypothetical protein